MVKQFQNFITIFCFLFFGNQLVTAQIYFVQEYSQARAIARSTDKPMLLYFTTKKCDLCRYVDTLFRSDTTLFTLLNQNFINVLINESKASLPYLDKFEVMGFPSIVFIRHDETVFKKYTNFYSSEDIIQTAEKAIDLHKGYIEYKMDLDTVTNPRSLLTLTKDFKSFNPDDNVINIINEVTQYRPFLKNLLFKDSPELLNYKNLNSIFLEDNTAFIKSDNLRDLYAYAYFKQSKIESYQKKVKDLEDRFTYFGFENLKEVVLYIEMKEILAQKDENGVNFGIEDILVKDLKNFLLIYPHCPDKTLVSNIMSSVLLSTKSEGFYTKLFKVVEEKLKTSPNNFMLMDIQAACYYMTGYKENSLKMIAKINEIALLQGQTYQPSLKVLQRK